MELPFMLMNTTGLPGMTEMFSGGQSQIWCGNSIGNILATKGKERFKNSKIKEGSFFKMPKIN